MPWEFICNIPLMHTNSCLKDMVSNWKREMLIVNIFWMFLSPAMFLCVCQRETSCYLHWTILSGCLEQLQYQVHLAGFGNWEEQFLWLCSCPVLGLALGLWWEDPALEKPSLPHRFVSSRQSPVQTWKRGDVCCSWDSKRLVTWSLLTRLTS